MCIIVDSESGAGGLLSSGVPSCSTEPDVKDPSGNWTNPLNGGYAFKSVSYQNVSGNDACVVKLDPLQNLDRSDTALSAAMAEHQSGSYLLDGAISNTTDGMATASDQIYQSQDVYNTLNMLRGNGQQLYTRANVDNAQIRQANQDIINSLTTQYNLMDRDVNNKISQEDAQLKSVNSQIQDALSQLGQTRQQISKLQSEIDLDNMNALNDAAAAAAKAKAAADARCIGPIANYNFAYMGSIPPNTTLQTCDALQSTDGAYFVALQSDGDLRLFDGRTNDMKWSSGTGDGGNNAPYTAVYQSDNNFVIYNSSKPSWSTVTWNSSPDQLGEMKLTMQTDGDLVITNSTSQNNPVWHTNTAAPKPPQPVLVPALPTPVVSVPPPPAYKSCAGLDASYSYLGDTIPPGTSLNQCMGIRSPNGRFILVMQSDGNLVLYDTSTRQPLWASNTYDSGSSPPYSAEFQNDYNFVVYKGSEHKPTWASQTYNKLSDRLVMQNDGNVVIYRGNTAIWATNTAIPSPPPPPPPPPIPTLPPILYYHVIDFFYYIDYTGGWSSCSGESISTVSFDQADANLVTAYKTLGQIESYAGDPGNPRAFNGAGNIGDGVYIGKRIANSSKDYINNIDEMKNTSSMLMQVRDDNIIDYSQKTDHPPRWWY
jgi:hypothetical protein